MLAVIQGTHGSRIDIQVWINFDGGNSESVRLHQQPRTGSNDALSDTRNNTAANNDIFDHVDENEKMCESAQNESRKCAQNANWLRSLASIPVLDQVGIFIKSCK